MADILVIEDNPEMLRTLVRLLKAKGHTVTTATTYTEAEVALNEPSLELVISDFNLGDSTVEPLFLAMRTQLKNFGTAFVVTTGRPDEAASLKSYGVPVYQKPILPDDLQKILETYLSPPG